MLALQLTLQEDWKIITEQKKKYTKTGLPWILMYKEEFMELKQARLREHNIKKMKSRKFIEALISSAG